MQELHKISTILHQAPQITLFLTHPVYAEILFYGAKKLFPL